MTDWFTLQTFVAFVLGVLLAASVKGLVSSAKSKVSGG
jgi:hypothetical protein